MLSYGFCVPDTPASMALMDFFFPGATQSMAISAGILGEAGGVHKQEGKRNRTEPNRAEQDRTMPRSKSAGRTASNRKQQLPNRTEPKR